MVAAPGKGAHDGAPGGRAAQRKGAAPSAREQRGVRRRMAPPYEGAAAPGDDAHGDPSERAAASVWWDPGDIEGSRGPQRTGRLQPPRCRPASTIGMDAGCPVVVSNFFAIYFLTLLVTSDGLKLGSMRYFQ
jgi:hypothetical protein